MSVTFKLFVLLDKHLDSWTELGKATTLQLRSQMTVSVCCVDSVDCILPAAMKIWREQALCLLSWPLALQGCPSSPERVQAMICGLHSPKLIPRVPKNSLQACTELQSFCRATGSFRPNSLFQCLCPSYASPELPSLMQFPHLVCRVKSA